MAYYYYYQQHQAPPGPLSPGATVTDVTPLLLLSPSHQQHQLNLNLPILTPVLPSTTIPITTTTATTEYDQQHQLPTPNTFIKHCEDMGLFHDLQNIVVMSSLSGSQGDTVTTEIPVTTINTNSSMVTTTAQSMTSNIFSSSSTENITTMMMANPFDETFKQAVLQQQNNDANPSKKVFNDYKNNNNGDLNTPFIVPTTVEILNSNNKTTASADTSNVVEVPTSVESISMNTATVSQSQQNNMFISTESIQHATPSGGVLLMMMDQQQSQQQNLIQPQNSRIVEQRQRVIVPNTAMMVTSVIDSMHMCDDHDKDKNVEVVAINVENETTSIKQALKRNLLVKRLIQGRQKLSLVPKKHEQQQQQQHNNKINDDNHAISINKINQSHNENNDDNRKLKQKQELLERNRSAAKRCRMKRKQRWDLLSEENRKLKAENYKLRNALTKLITSGCGDLQQHIQQSEIN